MKILIFIITYQASFRVKQIINEIPFNNLKKNNYQILISDDYSTDDTQKYIHDIKKKNKKIIIKFNSKNLGYGANIKTCINYGYKNKFDYAIMIHGDNQYNPKYIKPIIDILLKNKTAAVAGTRMKKKYLALKGGMPIYKYIGNVLLTNLFNFLFKTNFTDCHTGYWGYNLNKIDKKWFHKFDNKFQFDLDFRLKAVQNNLIIKEVSINTRYGSERSSIHIKYAILFFLKILIVKISSFFNY